MRFRKGHAMTSKLTTGQMQSLIRGGTPNRHERDPFGLAPLALTLRGTRRIVMAKGRSGSTRAERAVHTRRPLHLPAFAANSSMMREEG
jgi:hypothetical protein